MRGLVEDLGTPHPLGEMLPALYLEDPVTQLFCDGLDRVLAPVIATINGFDSYIDPRVAPQDFLEWLASWVALTLDDNWPEARQRAYIGQAVELYRWRGTARGIAQFVAVFTGIAPEVFDSGGVATAGDPGVPWPGSADAEVVVRLRVADPAQIDVAQVEAIVAAAKPAHVAHRVEVLQA